MAKITYDNVLPGFLLLLLAICGNFLGTTFSCELQKLLHSNYYFKNILIFVLLYFTIYFSEYKPEHPSISIVKTIIIYIYYCIFTKQSPQTLLLSLLLLVVAFICEQYKDYVTDGNSDIFINQSNTDKIHIAQITLLSCAAALTLYGFISSYLKFTKNPANKSITFLNYFFGAVACNQPIS